ncbi:ATP-dependent protease ClpP protease subunit [Agrobacterium vitis]|nr:ATP-dependent protease ClpP protease subunit [Agrobacterium vitis]
MPEKTSLITADSIVLYGDVGDPYGWGDGFTPAQVLESLAQKGPGPLAVRINSGGGVAFDGMAIYSLLKAHDGDVTIYVDGIAASAASLIAMGGKLMMRSGSMLMIHDAWGFSRGNADEMKETADILDKLSDNYANVYAKKSGKTVAECREIMKAETWLSAEDAVAMGFADGIIDDDEAKPAALFDYSQYARAPEAFAARVRKPPAREPAPQTPTPPSQAKVADMPTSNPVTPPAPHASNPAPQPAAKAWAIEFYTLAASKGLTLADANTIVINAADIGSAKDALIDALASRQSGNLPEMGHRSPAHITADSRDKFRAGVTEMFLGYAGIGKVDTKSEFMGMKPMDLIRECAMNAGIRPSTRDPMKLVAAVMTNSSSDFGNITLNIAEKSMLKGYEEAPETFDKWTGVASLPDFKLAKSIDLNTLPELPALPEQAEYKYLTTGDRGEYYQVATAGGLFAVSRQAIINDDLDVFTKLPRRLGRSAKRTIGNSVAGVLASNPIMSDDNPLFSAVHANAFTGAGSALNTAGLQAAWQAMALQKDRSVSTNILNIRPKYLLVPVALKMTALQLIKSSAALGQNNAGVINAVQNLVEEIIDEPRLDAISSTGWYLAADQHSTDTVTVAYLNGVTEPVIEEFTEPRADGLTWKVRIDYGVSAMGWEGLNKSAGA